MHNLSSKLPTNKEALKPDTLMKIKDMARRLSRAVSQEIRSRHKFTPTETMEDMGGNTGSKRFSTKSK